MVWFTYRLTDTVIPKLHVNWDPVWISIKGCTVPLHLPTFLYFPVRDWALVKRLRFQTIKVILVLTDGKDMTLINETGTRFPEERAALLSPNSRNQAEQEDLPPGLIEINSE